jgi:DTW domain-containing protein
MRTISKTAPRCPQCGLPLRWCICAAQRTVTCALAVDVLVHHREWYRPSSTSGVIARVIPDSRRHLWRRERRLTAAEVRRPGRDLWILHPHGAPAPAGVEPEAVQVLLLDGSWRESSAMAQEVGAWGRLVALPLQGESRYWLRAQADAGRFSTIEALLFLLGHFGLTDARDVLRTQFELHVYASLRTRGHKMLAAEFLGNSPARAAFPEILAELDRRRPRE